MDDGSKHDYDNDIYNGRHGVRRDGQPREDTRRHSRSVNEKPGGNKEDTREIIRREQERKRTKEQDKEEDQDKEHGDKRQRRYNRPYERRWCSICHKNGEQEWRCKTHDAINCTKYSETKHHANDKYTDDELHRAKQIITEDMKRNGFNTTSRSSKTQHQLPADTEHGMGDSDDEGDESQTEHMRKYLGVDFPR